MIHFLTFQLIEQLQHQPSNFKLQSQTLSQLSACVCASSSLMWLHVSGTSQNNRATGMRIIPTQILAEQKAPSGSGGTSHYYLPTQISRPCAIPGQKAQISTVLDLRQTVIQKIDQVFANQKSRSWLKTPGCQKTKRPWPSADSLLLLVSFYSVP